MISRPGNSNNNDINTTNTHNLDLSWKQVVAILLPFLCFLSLIVNYQIQKSVLPTPLVSVAKETLGVLIGKQLVLHDKNSEHAVDLSSLAFDWSNEGFALIHEQELSILLLSEDETHQPQQESGFFDKQPKRYVLQKCHLETLDCKPLIKDIRTRFIDLYVHDDNRIVLSETPEHTVSVYSPEGSLLAVAKDHLSYPNQTRIIGSRLWIANTKQKEIISYDIQNDFLVNYQSHWNEGKAMCSDGEFKPVTFVPFQQGWAAVVRNNSLLDGSLYLFNSDFTEVEQIALEENSYVMKMEAWDSGAVLSDMEHRKLWVLNSESDLLEFNTPLIDSILNGIQNELNVYSLLSDIGIVCIFLLVLGIFSVIIRQLLRFDIPQLNVAEEEHVHLDEPAIDWVKKNELLKYIVFLTALLPMFMLPLMMFANNRSGLAILVRRIQVPSATV